MKKYKNLFIEMYYIFMFTMQFGLMLHNKMEESPTYSERFLGKEMAVGSIKYWDQ